MNLRMPNLSTKGRRNTRFIESLEPRRLLAATLDFAFSIGSDDFDTANTVAVDPKGNIYVAGGFSESVDFDPRRRREFLLPGQDARNDVFIAKYSPDHRLLWARAFGGPRNDAATHLAIGPGGQVYLAGLFTGRINFGTRKQPLILDGRGDEDVFLARFGPNGRVIWAGTITGGRDDAITAMDVGPDGDLYIAGTVRLDGDLDPGPGVHRIVTRGVDDTFISRLRAEDGALRWTRIYGEDDTREGVAGMKVDAAGGVFVAGTFVNTVQFDREDNAFNRRSEGRDDIYLARLTPDGRWDFLTTIGSGSRDTVVDLARGPDGDLFITGNFERQLDFDPGPGQTTLASIGRSDAFVARYRDDGSFVWAQQFGSRRGRILAKAVAVDSRGFVYTTGDFEDEIDFHPGNRTFILDAEKSRPRRLAPLGQSDVYISKLNPRGRFRAAVQIGGRETAIVAEDLALDPRGNPVVVGRFTDVADFAPGPGRFVRRTTRDREDADGFVLKLQDV